MTLVNIDLKNAGYETGPDDRVVFYSPANRNAQGTIISTAEKVVELADGQATVELAPGPVVVKILAQGVADTREKSGYVPESGPVSLWDIILDWTPALVDQGILAILAAVEDALGQVSGAVAAEVDAIKWARGAIPDDATLDSLADGIWWSSLQGVQLGLPSNMTGSLEISSASPSYKAATFTSISADNGVYTNRKSVSSGGWAGWVRSDAGVTQGAAPMVPAGSTLDDVATSPTWVNGTSEELGLPAYMYGSLSMVSYTPNHKTALFQSIAADAAVYVNRRSTGGWRGWVRIDAGAITSPTEPVLPAQPPADYFPDPNAPLEANESRVVMWGDSLTHADYIRQRLAELQPGSEFVNRGIGSQTALQIAARQGGGMATIEVTGGTIPASGSVAVTKISQRVLLQTSFPARELPGTIRGVHGTLSNAAGTHDYVFTRTEPGFSVAVPEGTFFVPDDALLFRHDAQIIWAGRNDATGADPIQGVRSMLQWLSPAKKRVAVIALTGDSTWLRGSAKYEETVRINAELERMCGDSFIDLRRWLIDHGLDAVGKEPTPADLDAIAGDAIPPSLSSDGTHFVSSTQTAIGSWLHGELLARGWWSTSA